MTAVYIIMILAAVVMLLSLIPINVIADFAYNYSDNSLYLKFLFFRIKLYPTYKQKTETLKIEEKQEESPDKETDTDYTVRKVWSIYQALKENIFALLDYIFTKALAVKELNISAVLGTGNPMYTGLLCGTVNAAVYGILGAADAKMKIKNHNVDINFDFDNVKCAAGIYTVIYTRAIYVYCIAAKALIILMKLRKTLKEVKEDE